MVIKQLKQTANPEGIEGCSPLDMGADRIRVDDNPINVRANLEQSVPLQMTPFDFWAKLSKRLRGNPPSAIQNRESEDDWIMIDKNGDEQGAAISLSASNT